MHYTSYAIDISSAYDYYEFISTGKKGPISKGKAFYNDIARFFSAYSNLLIVYFISKKYPKKAFGADYFAPH